MPLTTAQYNALNNSGGGGGDKFSLKSFMGDNAAALIGGGLGALFGTSGGSDGKNPSGYQGGIPDYVYNPTLKDNAFANTYQKEVPVTEWYTNPAGMLDQRNVPGATTSVTAPRRPGSMGRSYFDYPTTGGLYSPVTTTTDGVTTNNVMCGEYLANTSAAAEKARADQLAYNKQIGQAYIDVYGENYGTGEGIDSTLTEIQAYIDAQVQAYIDAQAGGSGIVTGSLGSGSVTGNLGSGVTGSTGSDGTGSGSGSVTVDAIPNIGGTASTIGSAPTLGGVTTVTETPAVAASVTPGSTSATTTGGTSALYNYLSGMGFGETERNITADDVAAFGQQSVFTLGDIATALGTDPTALLSVANYTAPTALQTALGGMGFAVPGGRNITTDDISTLTDAGYAVEDIALALNVDPADLTSISAYVAPSDTTVALNTALSNMGFSTDASQTITKQHIADLTADGYALADIATALNVDPADLTSIVDYTAPTDLQTALVGLGFTADGQTITADHITSLTDDGYALGDIAEALDVGIADLAALSGYTTPTGLETALSTLGYDVTGGKVITAGDISTLTDGGYTLEAIAIALDVNVSDLNSISSYTVPTALQTALADLDFDVEGGKVITVGDITSLTDDGYALADIATALNVTEAQLNSIVSYTTPTGLEAALVTLGFDTADGKVITAGDISTLTDAGYALTDIATALDVTTDQLNSISSYTVPTALQTALSNMDYDVEGGKTITKGDISTLTQAPNNFTLDQIAEALDVTTDQLNSIVSYTTPTGLQTALSTLGYAVEGGKVITAEDINNLTGADYGFSLADIATALNVTEAQLNSVVSYTAPTPAAIALNNYLVGMGYSEEDKDITKADVQAWQDQDTYTLAAIADALGTTEAILISISNASAAGGLLEGNQGYYLGGPTDGMADNVPATIDGAEPARLSDGEFVVPADVVSHLGNGNSEAGSEQLYSMMDRVRQERTGSTRQGAQINPMRQLPA